MSEDLQFDRAEMPAQNLANCRQCQAPLRDHYFQVSGAMLCDQCVDAVRQALAPTGSSAERFARAFFFGGGAAVVSAIGYGLWLEFTNINFALITIAMGWFIGGAVRRGSGGRGGWRYGLLAVFLTYMAISFSYFGVGLAKPFAVAAGNIISILIIGFGLWQAWSMNRAVDVQITGPHLIGDSNAAGA